MESFIMSKHITSLARRILEKSNGIEELTEVPSQDGSPSSALSPNKSDLISVQELIYEGKTYYLGLPK